MSAEEPTTPSVSPRPTPRPSPGLKPIVTVVVPVADWGRVSDDGTVEVREGDDWRVVGQYPDGATAEALAYFTRKYEELAFKVQALEQRQRTAGTTARELRTQADQLVTELIEPAAVGDLVALRERLAALTEALVAMAEQEAAQAKEAVDAAVAERTKVVEAAEAIASRDSTTVQWKQVTAELSSLFDQWQAQQQTGPRLPKSVSQQLWRRFRDARTSVDRARRAFFSELDESHKIARDAKTRLVERAEALRPQGAEGITAYRGLLDQWKDSGRAGRKADDLLWARFKSAGDALYSARADQAAAEEADSAPRIEARTALLAKAKEIADEPDLKKARAALTRIQKEWEEVGRISPREKERALDDKMRVIEQGVKAREDVDWKRNNPETRARADGMSQQLLAAIAKLEQALDTAKNAGDQAAIADAQEALDARKAWLSALGN